MSPVQTILCALDGGRSSEAAAALAADLTERTGARLHFVHVDPPPEPTLTAAPDGRLDRALGPEVHVVRGQAPSDAVLRLAETLGVDLVVVGTHATRGLTRAFAGSTAAETVRRARAPVLVVPEASGPGSGPGPGPARPVLAAVDYSELAGAVLDHASALAAVYGAVVEPAHVLQGGAEARPAPLAAGLHPDGAPQVWAARVLRDFAREAGLAAETVHVAAGVPGPTITRLAHERHAGAVVLGTHGRTGWGRMRLGSVAEWVARHAPCPVLTVPTASAAASAPDA